MERMSYIQQYKTTAVGIGLMAMALTTMLYPPTIFGLLTVGFCVAFYGISFGEKKDGNGKNKKVR